MTRRRIRSYGAGRRNRWLSAIVACGFVLLIGTLTAVSVNVASSRTSSPIESLERGRGNAKAAGKAVGKLRKDSRPNKARSAERGVLVVKGTNRTVGSDATNVPVSTSPDSLVDDDDDAQEDAATSAPGDQSGDDAVAAPSSGQRESSSDDESTNSASNDRTDLSVSDKSTDGDDEAETDRTTPTAPPTTQAEKPTTTTTTRPPTTAPPTTQRTTTTSKPSSGAGEWYEGFDSLNTSRWAPEHSTYGDGNGERQCYQPGNVSVQNGRLTLRAREESATCPNGSTRSISSGMVRSQGLAFSPGQAIEFRVRLNVADSSNQAGLWPAVWASSWAGRWPEGGELDFLEVMTAEDPNRAMFSMHYADGSGRHELQNKPTYLDGTFSGNWQTIRFDYGHGGQLTWYLNGRQVFQVDSASTRQGYPAPFDQTIREIKINLAVGGSPGPLGGGVLSSDATFEVDYIRVFNL